MSFPHEYQSAASPAPFTTETGMAFKLAPPSPYTMETKMNWQNDEPSASPASSATQVNAAFDDANEHFGQPDLSSSSDATNVFDYFSQAVASPAPPITANMTSASHKQPPTPHRSSSADRFEAQWAYIDCYRPYHGLQESLDQLSLGRLELPTTLAEFLRSYVNPDNLLQSIKRIQAIDHQLEKAVVTAMAQDNSHSPWQHTIERQQCMTHARILMGARATMVDSHDTLVSNYGLMLAHSNY